MFARQILGPTRLGAILAHRASGNMRQARRTVADQSTKGSAGEQHIYNRLYSELEPTRLSVTDSSGGCGSMYVVEIEAERFRSLTRVKQTKLVTSLLKDEIQNMHGIRVLCSVPPSL